MLLQEARHIVIVQTAFIGDVALALYLAQTVRALAPLAHITFVTTPVAASLVACCTAVNTVVPFDKRKKHKGLRNAWKFGKELRTINTKPIDILLAPHRSFRTALVASLARPTFSVSFDISAFRWLYSSSVTYQRNLHEVERNHQLLTSLDDASSISLPNITSPSMELPSGTRKKVRDIVDAYIRKEEFVGGKYIVIAPGSVWATKRWKEDYFIRITRNLMAYGIPVVLAGGRDDQAICERITEATKCFSLAGKTSLPEMLALLEDAELLICNDSAPTHLAGLVQCPVVTMFGPTVPTFGFAPRGEHDIVLENKDLDCRPCSIHGTHKCPLGTHECMVSVAPETVYHAALKILEHT